MFPLQNYGPSFFNKPGEKRGPGLVQRGWTLSDNCNTTTDTSTKLEDGHGCAASNTAYFRNMELLHANSVNEVNELQSHLRQRMVYNTNHCNVRPIYPAWNNELGPQCRPSANDVVTDAIRADTTLQNTHLNAKNAKPTNVKKVRWDASSIVVSPVNGGDETDGNDTDGNDTDTDIDTATNTNENRGRSNSNSNSSNNSSSNSKRVERTQRAKKIPVNAIRAVNGIIYDSANWKKLPLESTKEKFEFIIGRDNRAVYVLLVVLLALLLISIIIGIKQGLGHLKQKNKQKDMLARVQANSAQLAPNRLAVQGGRINRRSVSNRSNPS